MSKEEILKIVEETKKKIDEANKRIKAIPKPAKKPTDQGK